MSDFTDKIAEFDSASEAVHSLWHMFRETASADTRLISTDIHQRMMIAGFDLFSEAMRDGLTGGDLRAAVDSFINCVTRYACMELGESRKLSDGDTYGTILGELRARLRRMSETADPVESAKHLIFTNIVDICACVADGELTGERMREMLQRTIRSLKEYGNACKS